MGDTRLDLAVTVCHRARICVRRLLRADEIVTVVRDLLAALRSDERSTVVIGAWGDVLLENTIAADGSRPGKLDLFGLGVVAFRLLTGALPRPDTRYVPGAPPAVAQLITRLLSPDAKTRPTQQDTEMAIAIMLGGVPVVEEVRETAELLVGFDDEPIDFEVVDSFDDDAQLA